MADFETIQAEANRLIEQQPPALPEIRKLMVEMDEFFNSADFQGLEREQRSELQGLYKELRARVRGPEAGGAQPATAGALPGQVSTRRMAAAISGQPKRANIIPRPSRR